jgi:hypothetical protein
VLGALEQKIRERAYALWVDHGMVHGMAHEHWMAAERHVMTEAAALSVELAATSTRKTAAKATAKASTKAATAKAIEGKTTTRKTTAPRTAAKPKAKSKTGEAATTL